MLGTAGGVDIPGIDNGKIACFQAEGGVIYHDIHIPSRYIEDFQTIVPVSYTHLGFFRESPLKSEEKWRRLFMKPMSVFLKREILTGKEFRYGSLFVKAVKKWFGTLRSIPNR